MPRIAAVIALVLALAGCGTTTAPPPSAAPPSSDVAPTTVVAGPETTVVAPTPTITVTPTTETTVPAPVTVTATPAPPSQGRQAKVDVTWYGAHDNDPPGSVDIAFPKGKDNPNAVHTTAGGVGTYADPLTFASPIGKGEYAVGQRIYVPSVRRYFVHEDSCGVSWTAPNGCGAVSHVDLYVGNPSGTEAVLACEDKLTPDGPGTIIIDPPPTLPVDAGPVWVEATKTCVTPQTGTATTTATPQPPPAVPPTAGRVYPVHTGIVSTTFWVGELFNATAADGSQVCSTYDAEWAAHWSGITTGPKAPKGTDCEGSTIGGCDGVPNGARCDTEARVADNGYFPRSPKVTPHENPFYLDLPFDDVHNPAAFKRRGAVVPWANDPGYAGKAGDPNVSLMKNRWVRIWKGDRVCYGQIEDAGPGQYNDATYVFGSGDARPASRDFNRAGMDVSPALNGCLGFTDPNGESDKVSWQFADEVDVPAGPWRKVVTTSGVTN